MKSGPSISDVSPQFLHLRGGTLQWWQLAVVHRTLLLRASDLPRGEAAIRFLYVSYIDGPVRMHNVHLRLATEPETVALRHRVSADLAPHVHREDYLVIECNEGTAAIVAEIMTIAWMDEIRADEHHWARVGFDGMDAPLWSGGPPVTEL